MRLFFMRFFLLFSLLQGTLIAQTIADRIQYLNQGDIILFDLHNNIAAIEACNVDKEEVELRIVSATKDVLSRHHLRNYIEWLTNGSKDAQYEEHVTIQKQKGILRSTISQAKWLETLLSLELYKIPSSSRRKSGPPPKADEIDLRPIWTPPLIIQGEKTRGDCEAFSTKWPEDGSPLSSRILVLYFPKSPNAIRAFPYWIDSPSSSFHVAVIDSRKNLLLSNSTSPTYTQTK